MRLRRLFLLPLLLSSAAAYAQDSALVTADEGGEAATVAEAEDAPLRAGRNEIVVIAERIRGQIDAAQPPIMVLNENDIQAYGASSIADLVAAISPQTGSGRGRGDGAPVILFNGQRIASFREFRNIPPEAIRRMEVLPEEVALRFGYRPDQRLINFILKDNFAAKAFDAELALPSRGGFSDSEFEATLLKINKSSRLNLNAQLNTVSMLTEAERGVRQATENIPTVAGDADPALFRSLIDRTRELKLGSTWSTGLGEDGLGGSLSLNGAFTQGNSSSLFGLDVLQLVAPSGAAARRSLADPLLRYSRYNIVQGGVTLNKGMGQWQLTATIDASHSDTQTDTDRRTDTTTLIAAARAGTLAIGGPLPVLPPAGFDASRTKDFGVNSLLTVIGSPLAMPAGDVSITLKAGFDYDRSINSDTRNGGQPVRLQRGDLIAGINMAVPIASRRNGVLTALGDLTLNFSGSLNHLSDFGTLQDLSAGLTWSPFSKLGLSASYMVNEAAPSLNQLGNPQQFAFNIPIFDFTRNETALITIINGGNRQLLRETQRDLKLSATWELPFLKNSSVMAEYFRNRSEDVTQNFPFLTPETEAAFPGRAVRDAAGRLISLDRRPVTFAATRGSRLRWGLNISGPLGKPRADAGAGPRPGSPMAGRGPGGGGPPRMGGRGGGGPGMGGPMMAMMGGGTGQGRWHMSAYHTFRIDETVEIASGSPVLDLLNGDALVQGGLPRHGLELETGSFYRGFGLHLNGRWSAPVQVRTSGAGGASDLRFGSVFRVNLRSFVNLGQQQRLIKAVPFLKGSRLAFTIDNLLDSRQKVTDASGVVPINFQPDYRDPRGRMIGVDFRKIF